MFTACGSVATNDKASLAERLVSIHDGLERIIGQFSPDEAAVEATFVNKDAQATLKLGHARAVALLVPALAGLPVAEYAANPEDLSVNLAVAEPLLKQLITPTRLRARIYDRDGYLLLDSRSVSGRSNILRFDPPPAGAPHADASPWTARAPLPGGDFLWDGVEARVTQALHTWPFLTQREAHRLVSAYGTRIERVLGAAESAEDLGPRFGPISAVEVLYLVKNEWVRTADDVIWRRSKLGLRMSKDETASLERFIAGAVLPPPAMAEDESDEETGVTT